MFEIQPTEHQYLKLTKELLLQKHSQEEYFNKYLGVPVKKGLFCSPLRKDKKPTCSFYLNNKGDLIYRDFANNFQGNFLTCVMEIFKCDYVKAMKIVANDFNIVTNPRLECHPPTKHYTNDEFSTTEKATIQVEIKNYTEEELDWWDKQGVSKIQLTKFKVFSLQSVFLNGSLFCVNNSQLIFGYYGGKTTSGSELWRIYFPKRKTFKWLSNWDSTTMIQGSKQLPKCGDLLVITKSLKDVMAMDNFGITAIAPCSENVFITLYQYIKLKARFKDIILLYDNDLPGISAMNRIRKKFEIDVYFIPRKLHSKDFSDLVKHTKNSLRIFNYIKEWQEERRKKLMNQLKMKL